MPWRRATLPIAAAGLVSPPLVGTQVTEMSFTRSSIMRSSAATSSSPLESLGTTSTRAPVRFAVWR
jgi:hypothetical protein